MAKEQKGLQNTLNSAKEALSSINQDKFPKLYASKEGEIKALEIAIDKEKWARRVAKESKTPKNNPGDATPKNNKKFSLEDVDEITTLSEIHKEDREEICDYAERKGVKVSEALNQPFIRSFLKEREEERKSQETSNTGKGQTKISKSSDKRLLDQLEKGELPEEDIEAAVRANLKRMKKGN